MGLGLVVCHVKRWSEAMDFLQTFFPDKYFLSPISEKTFVLERTFGLNDGAKLWIFFKVCSKTNVFSDMGDEKIFVTHD